MHDAYSKSELTRTRIFRALGRCARSVSTVACYRLVTTHLDRRELRGTSRALQSGSMVPPRALVADDHADLLEVVSHILEQVGIDVVRASCAADLLERLAADGPFDVIVTDVEMPWMTALHVMQSAHAAGLTCPVIVMTVRRDRKTNAQIGSLGQDVHLLPKPFSRAQLWAALFESLRPRPVTPRSAEDRP
jgi:two-component system cell cycle response regulator CpdR